MPAQKWLFPEVGSKPVFQNVDSQIASISQRKVRRRGTNEPDAANEVRQNESDPLINELITNTGVLEEDIYN